jgi:hypothetical protein
MKYACIIFLILASTVAASSCSKTTVREHRH